MTKLHKFQTIDPGKDRLFVAYFAVSISKGLEGLPFANYFGAYIIPGLPIACEYPQLHRGHPRPQDIVDLAFSLGEVRHHERQGTPVTRYKPSAWKGQQKKPPHHRKIWAAMFDSERELIANIARRSVADCADYIDEACERLARTGKVTGYSWEAHNWLDALGLGLKHCRRM